MRDMCDTIEELLGPGCDDFLEITHEEAASDDFLWLIYSDKEKKILQQCEGAA